MDEHHEDVGAESGAPRATAGVVPLLLTIPQAAAVLAVGRTTVYELIGVGDLEAVHIGRSVRVPVERTPDLRRSAEGVSVTGYRHRRAQRLVALATVPMLDIAEEVSSSGVH